MRRFFLYLFFLCLSFKISIAQNVFVNHPTAQSYFLYKHDVYEKPIFHKIELGPSLLKNNSNLSDFYPLNNGDFCEFLEFTTTTLLGVKLLIKFYVSKEIIRDKLLSNVFTYKKFQIRKIN